MTSGAMELSVQRNVPIPTWFGIGGGADRFAVAGSVGDLRRCLEIDPGLRVLGEGANLLVDDEGVGELVVSMKGGGLKDVEWDEASGVVRAGAGADLAQLVTQSVRRGLRGIEGLGGIPATLGGAIIMNAGGAFGEIGGAVSKVFALTRDGREIEVGRGDAGFGYRRSELHDLLVTGAELRLTHDDAGTLRERLKEVMAYKKKSQPMAEKSAGCCFKNPTPAADLRDASGEIARAGQRVSAGLLIDRAGLKGLRVGGASVSERHANFLVTTPDARARDVIALMDEVVRRVRERFGVTLEPEVVVWRRKA